MERVKSSEANALLSVGKNEEKNRSAEALAAAETVNALNEALKNKPESKFTDEDHFARGLSELAAENFQSALSSFESALGLTTAQTPTQAVAQYVFAKGVTLGKLKNHEAAVAIYDELDQSFGADPTPAVRQIVAISLGSKGSMLSALGKFDLEIAAYDELDQRFATDTTPAVRDLVAQALFVKGFALGKLDKFEAEIATYTYPRTSGVVSSRKRRSSSLDMSITGLKHAERQSSNETRAVVLGNLGYGLFLAGDKVSAREVTFDCLRLGGQVALDAQLTDAKLHRVEDVDSAYEQMLDKLWAELPPAEAQSLG